MEVSGQLHVLTSLPPGKDSWYPLNRRLDGTQNRAGRCREGKTSFTPVSIRSLNFSAVQPITIALPTELSRLPLCPDLRQNGAVACFPHVGTVETQKPRNTHATIEVRVFIARCYVTQR
jgi:hypothetical protein